MYLINIILFYTFFIFYCYLSVFLCCSGNTKHILCMLGYLTKNTDSDEQRLTLNNTIPQFYSINLKHKVNFKKCLYFFNQR